MNHVIHRALAPFALLVSLAGFAGTAQAQVEDMIPTENSFETAENFTIELRIGPYVPDFDDAQLNNAFDVFYPDDNGLMWELQLDVLAFTMPDILDLGVGGLIGRANYSGKTLVASGLDSGTADQTDEESSFRILPLAMMASLRIDALARKLSVPFILTGKLGYQWAHYVAESGTPDERKGWSHGLRWAGQLAIDLDTFEPSQARMMDEEWGINHSFVFFEYYGFRPSKKSLGLGANTWTAGLGFMF